MHEALPALRSRVGNERELAVAGGLRPDRGAARALLDEVPELREEVVPDEVAELERALEHEGHGRERARRRLQERQERQIFVRARARVRASAAGAAPARASAAPVRTGPGSTAPAPDAASAVEPAHRARRGPVGSCSRRRATEKCRGEGHVDGVQTRPAASARSNASDLIRSIERSDESRLVDHPSLG